MPGNYPLFSSVVEMRKVVQDAKRRTREIVRETGRVEEIVKRITGSPFITPEQWATIGQDYDAVKETYAAMEDVLASINRHKEEYEAQTERVIEARSIHVQYQPRSDAEKITEDMIKHAFLTLEKYCDSKAIIDKVVPSMTEHFANLIFGLQPVDIDMMKAKIARLEADALLRDGYSQVRKDTAADTIRVLTEQSATSAKKIKDLELTIATHEAKISDHIQTIAAQDTTTAELEKALGRAGISYDQLVKYWKAEKAKVEEATTEKNKVEVELAKTVKRVCMLRLSLLTAEQLFQDAEAERLREEKFSASLSKCVMSFFYDYVQPPINQELTTHEAVDKLRATWQETTEAHAELSQRNDGLEEKVAELRKKLAEAEGCREKLSYKMELQARDASKAQKSLEQENKGLAEEIVAHQGKLEEASS